MTSPLIIDTSAHWAAVIIYVIATVLNAYGLIFENEKAYKKSYYIALAGLLVHGLAILYRWNVSGHGPYMARYEVMSSNAWMALSLFIVFSKFIPKIRPASIIVFPSVFLMIAIGIFFNPEVTKLPPSLRSIWLVLHVSFYKIALGSLLIALAFSIFYILKNRTQIKWVRKLPELDIIDNYAYRFAGFGFTFWAIAMLAGSIWAYESWGRYWGWDAIETWSLITWISFGIYLHMRRFFGLKGEKASYLFMVCFILSIIALFFTSLIESSVHSEYFRS
jgi:cytochrome c-type biogenesis protein CcsB